MNILIAPDGTARCVYGEAVDLARLGDVSVRRASRVEPDPEGRWHADLSPVGGPALGPFRTRSEALDAEACWLDERWLTAARPRSVSPLSPVAVASPSSAPADASDRPNRRVPMRLIVMVLIVLYVLLVFFGCLDRGDATRRGTAAAGEHHHE